MNSNFKLWGTATVGTKGQIVIPVEARDKLNISESDKLLVVSPPNSSALVIIRQDVLEEYLNRIQNNVKDILGK